MLTIQYISPKQSLIDVYGDNFGRVFLDVGDFEARLTKVLDSSDLTRIRQEAALGGALPLTQKNRALLEKYRPDVLNRTTEPMQIEVLQDGERVNLDAANIVEWDESGNVAEFEPFGQSYLDLLELVILSDIDLGVFEYTRANIEANWADRDSTIQAGLADYGAWNTPGTVEIQDFRIWFRLVSLMKAVACHIGWNFKSPHWEIGEGRHLLGYLSDEYWHFYSSKTGDRFVQLNIATPRSQAASIDFTLFDEVYDPNNLYNNIIALNQYIYGGFVNYDQVRVVIRVTNLSVTLPPSPPGGPAYTYVFAIKRNNGGAEFSFAHSEFITGSADQTVTKTINFSYTDYDASGDETYEFFMFYQDISTPNGNYSAYTLNSCDIDIIVDEPKYVEGDTIPVGELLSSKITGLDLLQAMSHLCNGKITTDYGSKTIHLYSPYDYYTQDGTTKVEGFFIEGKAIDLRDKAIVNETSWEDKSSKNERFLIYKFASSSDEYLESDEYLSKRVDLGVGTNKEKKIENPLFEATGEITVNSSNVGGTGDIRIPALWDNAEFKLSSDLGARVANYYGLISQSGNTWNFNGDVQTLVPYLSQLPTFALPAGVDLIPVTFNGFSRSIYNLHYEREVTECRSRVVYSLLLTGGDETYDLITFRRKVLIKGDDSALEMQPTAIKDHPAGSRVPLLVEFRMT